MDFVTAAVGGGGSAHIEVPPSVEAGDLVLVSIIGNADPTGFTVLRRPTGDLGGTPSISWVKWVGGTNPSVPIVADPDFAGNTPQEIAYSVAIYRAALTPGGLATSIGSPGPGGMHSRTGNGAGPIAASGAAILAIVADTGAFLGSTGGNMGQPVPLAYNEPGWVTDMAPDTLGTQANNLTFGWAHKAPSLATENPRFTPESANWVELIIPPLGPGAGGPHHEMAMLL